uniref:KAP family P-loop NTPase fold protein n=1 Tax=Candidatus Electronema sp. TaxID=2698783 RepID=UPI004057B165
MKYKLSPLEIPAEEPFRHDALDRKPSVEALARLIEELQGPFVLAIDSPWGTGKTTFVQLLKAVLEGKSYSCLYFDAWKTDFSTDPLVAFLGEIAALISKEIQGDTNFQKAKKIATKLAKRGIPAAAKIATAGILDFDALTEKSIGDGIADSLSDAVDDYLKQSNLIEEFRSSLGKAIVKLNEDGKKAQIIIFVDEIDRCRPVYAVELLERIKHLFNIENVIFVISLDKQQLHNSLGAVYGQGINSDEYLRRFIDLEYMLPKPDARAFTNNLFNRFEFDKFFMKRRHGEFGYEQQNLIETFADLSDAFALSLRAREQCFTMIRVAMLATQGKRMTFIFEIISNR